MPSAQFQKLVNSDASHNFIEPSERDDLARHGLINMIRAALADGTLSEAYDHRIDELQRAFGITIEQLGGDGTALAKARILCAIDAGAPNKVRITVDGTFAPRLESDEPALWSFPGAVYLTLRSRTHFVGGSSGVSIRIMRGVYYHASGFRGAPVKNDYLSTEDTGALTVAARNIYFVGSHKALKIPLKKIVSAQLYRDAIEILQSGASAKPAIFKIDDPHFAANLIARL
jgi:hypothetical protein